MPIIHFIHTLSIAVWVGGMVFFSFILTPTLFKSLSKEMVSQVLDVVFPKYYLMGYVCAVLALVSYLFLSVKVGWQTVVLVVMVLTTFYAGFMLYPKAHQLKVEMKSYATEEAVPAAVRTQFKIVHKWAVILNMLVLLLGFAYIWYLTRLLKA